jgi:hypothetical protein
MWFCGALYMETVVNRFLGNSAALAKYENWLKTVCDKNKVTRAEIETFYRQNIGALVAAEVDAQFNRVSFLVENYSANTRFSYTAVLARNAQNQYILSYERPDIQNSFKTLSPANSLEALSSAMSRSGDFVPAAINTVRAQAALIPAVRLSSKALNDIAVILEQFYTRPTAETYGYVKSIYSLYENTWVTSQDQLFMNIASSYANTLANLNRPLAERVFDDSRASSRVTLSIEVQQELIKLVR